MKTSGFAQKGGVSGTIRCNLTLMPEDAKLLEIMSRAGGRSKSAITSFALRNYYTAVFRPGVRALFTPGRVSDEGEASPGACMIASLNQRNEWEIIALFSADTMDDARSYIANHFGKRVDIEVGEGITLGVARNNR